MHEGLQGNAPQSGQTSSATTMSDLICAAEDEKSFKIAPLPHPATGYCSRSTTLRDSCCLVAPMEHPQQNSVRLQPPSVDFIDSSLPAFHPAFRNDPVRYDPVTARFVPASEPDSRTTSGPEDKNNPRGYQWRISLDGLYVGRTESGSDASEVESLAVLEIQLHLDRREPLSRPEVALSLDFDNGKGAISVRRLGLCLRPSFPGRWEFADERSGGSNGPHSITLATELPDPKSPLRLAVLFRHDRIQPSASLNVKLSATVSFDEDKGGKKTKRLETKRLDGQSAVPLELGGQGKNQRCPLSWAAEVGWPAFCQSVLERPDIDVNATDDHGRSPLSWAAGCGNITVLSMLLAREDVNPLRKDVKGSTPLSWAAANGHHDVCRLLIRSRPHIGADDRDDDLRTPLWWAAEHGHIEVVEALLDAGKIPSSNIPTSAAPPYLVADGDARDRHDESPIIRAAKRNHEEGLKLLVRNQLRAPHFVDRLGRDATTAWAVKCLHVAARKGWHGFAKALVEESPEIVDSKSTGNDTDEANQSFARVQVPPLYVAVDIGQASIVELLLNSGASPNIELSEGMDSPLLLALRKGRGDIATSLIKFGADTRQRNTRTGDDARTLATKMDLGSIHALLDKNDGDGAFATELTPKEADPITADQLFNATIIHFSYDEGVLQTKTDECSVARLFQSPVQRNKDMAFRWFHLPANNVSVPEDYEAGPDRLLTAGCHSRCNGWRYGHVQCSASCRVLTYHLSLEDPNVEDIQQPSPCIQSTSSRTMGQTATF